MILKALIQRSTTALLVQASEGVLGQEWRQEGTSSDSLESDRL